MAAYGKTIDGDGWIAENLRWLWQSLSWGETQEDKKQREVTTRQFQEALLIALAAKAYLDHPETISIGKLFSKENLELTADKHSVDLSKEAITLLSQSVVTPINQKTLETIYLEKLVHAFAYLQTSELKKIRATETENGREALFLNGLETYFGKLPNSWDVGLNEMVEQISHVGPDSNLYSRIKGYLDSAGLNMNALIERHAQIHGRTIVNAGMPIDGKLS